MTDKKLPSNGDDIKAEDTTVDKTDSTTVGKAGDAASGQVPDAGGKSAFETAIEKKKAAGQARSAHLDGGAKVGGATASHKTSRTFRRKSG